MTWCGMAWRVARFVPPPKPATQGALRAAVRAAVRGGAQSAVHAGAQSAGQSAGQSAVRAAVRAAVQPTRRDLDGRRSRRAQKKLVSLTNYCSEKLEGVAAPGARWWYLDWVRPICPWQVPPAVLLRFGPASSTGQEAPSRHGNWFVRLTNFIPSLSGNGASGAWRLAAAVASRVGTRPKPATRCGNRRGKAPTAHLDGPDRRPDGQVPSDGPAFGCPSIHRELPRRQVPLSPGLERSLLA